MEIFLALAIVAGCMFVIVSAMRVIRSNSISLDEPQSVSLDDAPEKPEWLYGLDGLRHVDPPSVRAMAVPRKRPIVQTRNTKTF